MNNHLALFLGIFVATSPPSIGMANDALSPVRIMSNGSVYIDPATIKHDGDNAYVWSVWDHSSQQLNVFDEPYRSVRLYNEYNCINRTMRLLEVMEFEQSKGEGDPIRIHDGSESVAKPIPSGTVAEEIFTQICKGNLRRIRDY
jgi:hypothetical protein